MNHDAYDDNYIRAILDGVKSIAMVGALAKTETLCCVSASVIWLLTGVG